MYTHIHMHTRIHIHVQFTCLYIYIRTVSWCNMYIYILGYIYIYMSHTPHMFSHELSCLCLHGGSLIQKHRWFSQDGWPDPKWPNKSGPTSCTGIYLFSVSEGPNFIKLQLVRITILDFWPPRFVVSKHPTIRFDPLGHSHVWTPSMGNGPPQAAPLQPTALSDTWTVLLSNPPSKLMKSSRDSMWYELIWWDVL